MSCPTVLTSGVSLGACREKESPLSVASAHANAFFTEVLRHQLVWTIRDGEGHPAPIVGGGQRAMPFWSLRSRAETIVSNVPPYQHFEVVAIELDIWRDRWLSGLAADGLLVGLNWSGETATGFDFRPEEVEHRLLLGGRR